MSTWRKRLASYARPHRASLALVVGLTLADAALNALKPWPLKLIVDSVLADKPFPAAVPWIAGFAQEASASSLIAWLAAATVVLFLASWASRMARGYAQSGVANRMVYALGADVFDRLQRLSLSFHNDKRAGDLVKCVTGDTQCVRELIFEVWVPLLTSLMNLAAMFFIMWGLDAPLSLLALCAVPGILLCIRVLSRPMMERKYEELRLQGEMMAQAEQVLTALPIVQAFNREEHEDGRFSHAAERTGKAFMRTIASQVKFRASAGSVTAIGRAAIMIVGGLRVLEGDLTLGSLLVILSYLTSLYAPLENLSHVSTGYASAAAGSRRLLEVLDAKESVKDAPAAKPLPISSFRRRGHIAFEGVSFGYQPGGRAILSDVWLEVQPGECVALVGATGSGKSTLVSLVPRLFDPWSGSVRFDGVDVRNVQLASLRSQVALVHQDPLLLPMSIAENIAYARPGANKEEIIAAAVAANADEFIRRLPRGYETVIGERGATLSGGERQRLSIARALLKDASVLILDEPTSALDAVTEASLLEGVERLTEGRTTFLITHRPSTIRRADRVVVLENGNLTETTPNRPLAARGPAELLPFAPPVLENVTG